MDGHEFLNVYQRSEPFSLSERLSLSSFSSLSFSFLLFVPFPAPSPFSPSCHSMNSFRLSGQKFPAHLCKKTSLPLFPYLKVIRLLEQKMDTLDYVLMDTPGQIEVNKNCVVCCIV